MKHYCLVGDKAVIPSELVGAVKKPSLRGTKQSHRVRRTPCEIATATSANDDSTEPENWFLYQMPRPDFPWHSLPVPQHM